MDEPTFELNRLAVFLAAQKEPMRNKCSSYDSRQRLAIDFVTGPLGLNIPRKHEDAAQLVVMAMRSLQADPVWFLASAITGEPYVPMKDGGTKTTKAADLNAPRAIQADSPKPTHEEKTPALPVPAWKQSAGQKKQARYDAVVMLVVPFIALLLTFAAVGLRLLHQ